MTMLPSEFESEPFAPTSAQFALCGTTSPDHRGDRPSRAGVRPWGLLRARPAGSGRASRRWRYDENEQKAVTVDNGVPLIDLPSAGDPSADTTSIVDGEDPPSSEDWNND